MITKQNIRQILECSETYAQKLINWAQGDEKKLVDLINTKLIERSIRPAMTILEVV
ncbi:hypothetical protein [Staphylococcus pseudintermedius]|uniref:hypothetical protein n=1 Tax=Staphylococcus pseudintermedius TaxID=283734 RepID=UPI000C1C3C86|nr:hypothetical protein [Staphylococcus pseudintermedius]MDU9318473.1 hypothetical protein [Staphylococcus pseudintermedius]